MSKPPTNPKSPANRRSRSRRKVAIQGETDTPALRAPIDPEPIAGHSLKSLLTGTSTIDWNFKIKLAEVFAAFLILFGTIYIGYKANLILQRQNVESQRLGSQQYQAAILQAYIASSITAGFDTEREQRMLNASLDLYNMLIDEDQKYEMLKTSMPAISAEQLVELVRRRPGDADRLFQLFARRSGVSRAVTQGNLGADSPYHIVIGTFRDRREGIERATSLLRSAQAFLTRSQFRPVMNIVRNEDGFVLATLSGFSTREDVIATLDRERIQTQFPDAYASQSRGWVTICSRRFEPCSGASPPNDAEVPPAPR